MKRIHDQRRVLPGRLIFFCVLFAMFTNPLLPSQSAHFTVQDNSAQNIEAALQSLRAEYPRIVAKFEALRYDCKSNMRIRVEEAMADATKWKHTVDVLGLLEEITVTDLNLTEKQLIVRDRLSRLGLSGETLEARVRSFNLNDLGEISADESRLVLMGRLRQRGMSERQIADILSGGEAVKRELRPLYEYLDRLTWQALRNAYNKAYQCCLCAAQDFFPQMMARLFQTMTLLSEAEALKVGSIEKNFECARAVQERLSGGEGWRGTITYTTKYTYKGNAQRGNNINFWDESSSYDATIQIDGKLDENGAPIARLTATANEKTANGGRGTVGCYRISEQVQEVSGAVENDKAVFTVSQNPRAGNYNISYTLTPVRANGTHKVTSKVGGICNNPFNTPLDQTSPVTNISVETGPYVEIEGQLDPENPDSLVGSKTVTVPGRRGGERTTIVSWNLLYCKKK
jgi:hypothetical protein